MSLRNCGTACGPYTQQCRALTCACCCVSLHRCCATLQAPAAPATLSTSNSTVTLSPQSLLAVAALTGGPSCLLSWLLHEQQMKAMHELANAFDATLERLKLRELQLEALKSFADRSDQAMQLQLQLQPMMLQLDRIDGNILKLIRYFRVEPQKSQLALWLQENKTAQVALWSLCFVMMAWPLWSSWNRDRHKCVAHIGG